VAPPSGLDQSDDAQIDAHLPYSPGSARSALSHPSFRSVWLGTFASNIGTWMQNIALGVFAFQLTHSATYVALLGFAQLGPPFLLSIGGGALADVIDRRRLLIACQVEQLVFSLALAWAASRAHPSTGLVFVCVLAVGIGNALNAPAFTAVLPTLVPRHDLPGAVSLQSGADEPVPGDRARRRRAPAPLRRRLGHLQHQRRHLRVRHRGHRPGAPPPAVRRVRAPRPPTRGWRGCSVDWPWPGATRWSATAW
jgi:hypothetical protein